MRWWLSRWLKTPRRDNRRMNDTLPVPILTEEQLAKNTAEQNARALNFKARFRIGNNKLSRAMAVIRETEAMFESVKSTTKRRAMLSPIQLDWYVDALANAGDFQTAHKFDPTKGYDKVWKAVWKEDNKQCKCSPRKQMQQDGQVEEYSNQFIQKTVHSLKHDRTVNLYKCASCGFMNAR